MVEFIEKLCCSFLLITIWEIEMNWDLGLEAPYNTSTRQLPMGAATAHGVGLLTEMYVIWRIIMCISTLAAAGEAVTDANTDGRKES